MRAASRSSTREEKKEQEGHVAGEASISRRARARRLRHHHGRRRCSDCRQVASMPASSIRNRTSSTDAAPATAGASVEATTSFNRTVLVEGGSKKTVRVSNTTAPRTCCWRTPPCADCASTKPDWVSLNLGVCLCVDCAGVHTGSREGLDKALCGGRPREEGNLDQEQVPVQGIHPLGQYRREGQGREALCPALRGLRQRRATWSQKKIWHPRGEKTEDTTNDNSRAKHAEGRANTGTKRGASLRRQRHVLCSVSTLAAGPCGESHWGHLPRGRKDACLRTSRWRHAGTRALRRRERGG